jgi:hypothetical protein
VSEHSTHLKAMVAQAGRVSRIESENATLLARVARLREALGEARDLLRDEGYLMSHENGGIPTPLDNIDRALEES